MGQAGMYVRDGEQRLSCRKVMSRFRRAGLWLRAQLLQAEYLKQHRGDKEGSYQCAWDALRDEVFVIEDGEGLPHDVDRLIGNQHGTGGRGYTGRKAGGKTAAKQQERLAAATFERPTDSGQLPQTVFEDMQWAYENVMRKGVDLKAAPTPGAAAWLQAGREDLQKFLSEWMRANERHDLEAHSEREDQRVSQQQIATLNRDLEELDEIARREVQEAFRKMSREELEAAIKNLDEGGSGKIPSIAGVNGTGFQFGGQHPRVGDNEETENVE